MDRQINFKLDYQRLKFIDFHTHSQIQSLGEVLEVVSIHPNKFKQANFYTIGYHPWWTMSILDDVQLDIIKQHYVRHQNCLGLGEFGLDKLKGSHLDIQEEIVIQQVLLANELNAPVVLHCVRAFDRLLHLAKIYQKTPWVVHGFVRNRTLAKQVVDAGIYLSVAPHQAMTATMIEMLGYLPLDRMFLETDSDFTQTIQQRYAIFATIKGLEMSELQVILLENFKIFFSEKWQYHIG